MRLEKLKILSNVSELLSDGDGHKHHVCLTLEYVPKPLLSRASFFSLMM